MTNNQDARSLGDAPTEAAYRGKMNALAHGIDEFFNGDDKDAAREIGFVLLVFPFGEAAGRCNYISNGADRRDIVRLLREQAERFEADMRARGEL